MKKLLILMLLLTLTVSYLFSDNLSAKGFGSTKSEAEKNAYIELSKIIRVSVFNEEIIAEKEDGGNLINSSFSTLSVQTTENTFPFTEKSFILEKDNSGKDLYICTVLLKESTSVSYIDSISNEYLKTIKLLETEYSNERETLSFEMKKNLINNIIEEYEKYDTAKYVLLALDKYPFDLPKPDKTIAIWQNEYQNIVINYSNRLQKEKEDLDTNINLSKDLIEKQIDEINIELAQANIDLQNIAMNKENIERQAIQQRQAEITNEVSNILNNIIKNDAILLTRDDSELDRIAIFDAYYSQYKNIMSEYILLINNQYDSYKKEVKAGELEIINKPYLYSEIDLQGNPLVVSKKIRDSEINKFLDEKEKEYIVNKTLITEKMRPTINQLQNNVLLSLRLVTQIEEFSVKVIPNSIEVELDNKKQEFILDIDFAMGLDNKISITIPFENVDQNLKFNISDENFNPNDEEQMKNYYRYKKEIDKYMNLLKNKTFLTFVININPTKTIANNDGIYTVNITKEISGIKVIRNDTLKEVYNQNLKLNDFYNKTFSNFIISDSLFEKKYYDKDIITFYNQINNFSKSKFTSYKDYIRREKFNDFIKTSIHSTFTYKRTSINDSIIDNLSQEYAFSNFDYGFDKKNEVLSEVILNVNYYQSSKYSLYLNSSIGYNTFYKNEEINDINLGKYKIIKKARLVLSLDLGINIPIYSISNLNISLIPYYQLLSTNSTDFNDIGGKVSLNYNNSAILCFGIEKALSGALKDSYTIYAELGI